MSRRGSWLTLRFRSVLDAVRASRLHSSYGGLQRQSPIMSPAKVGSDYWVHPGLQFFSTNSNTNTNPNGELKNIKVEPHAPASTNFSFPYWLRWVFGSLLSLLIPFWKHNWENLRRIEGEAVIVVEEVETVANVVEKVATVAERVSENIAEKLPGDGKLKEAALVVEHASKQVLHGAQLTEEFIHKVEELKNDLDDLESFMEPVIDKIVKKEPGKS
ncbi:hypothetical protein TanjilG_25622 [Lupinus angustifolius]|uniref:Uncharacterized protein n=1 Tax=Lupinus angustifolius TaxID=3871 RepID=A0A4P1QTC9_LUPAN|nr:PREDICTED: uncharacterized protein LOC109331511 [Lupinus angustifolius]OIV94560.1 hypothetical protein TanjilG_25622 [Lupinus angustifolius]